MMLYNRKMKKLLYIFTALFTCLQIQNTNAQTIIPGNDFEKWENMFVELPEGWLTSTLVDPFSEVKSASKSTDAYSGKYALRLETIESEYEGERSILPGFAISGKINFTENEMGFPCNFRPERLSFFYKYAPVFKDTMVVYIELRKTDPEYGPQIIGNGIFLGTDTKNTYTEGVLDIYYDSNETPDSAMIVIFSGTDTINAGSVLLIDHLQLDYHLGTAGRTPDMQKNFGLGNIYPQPAKDVVNFPLTLHSAQPVQIEITDMLGKNVATVQQNAQAGKNIIPCNTATYKPGIYVYKITAGSEVVSGKFIVEGK